MGEQEVLKTSNEIAATIYKEILKVYTGELYRAVSDGEAQVNNVAGFLLKPEIVVIHLGKTHFAIEYYGPEEISELPEKIECQLQTFDHTQTDKDLVEAVLGCKLDGTSPSLPLPSVIENMMIPNGDSIETLTDLGWNFGADNLNFLLNCGGLELASGRFHRIINAVIFNTEHGDLKTRRIKWVDFIPVVYDDSRDDVDSYSTDLGPLMQAAKYDKNYVYPSPSKNDYKYTKLPQLNRFIEVWGDSANNEPKITQFLESEENRFILTMRFGAKEAHSQLLCEWQSEQRSAIKPDFFVEQPNGFADILEFKLPKLKKSTVVGSSNRETFSAELASMIAQTRVYSEYFDDPNNRSWFENKYGFRVLKPKRYIVAGRRYDFDAEQWRKIQSDFHEVELLTYDDLIDGVVAQFYK
ncbi:MAG: Shedu anti-phage system protein SduA domain-containing protein [Pseudomonadota bacterium]